MSDHRRVTTGRLVLTAPAPSDLPELHALHADPRGYRYVPQGRHTTPGQTERLVRGYSGSWARYGLGAWVVRSAEDGHLVGMGGCSVRAGLAWNLYYRIAPAEWGRGYAHELAGAALAAAHEQRPDLPVVAYLQEANEGSRRTAERTGLRRVWRGQDAGDADPGAVRLVYADRDLDDVVLAAFTSP